MVNIINIQSIMYVGFRLAPFILISFFALSSLFNSDIKGIIFLSLLLLNCFITVSIGNSLPKPEAPNKNHICDGLALSMDGPISNLPLNINVFTFTLAYLAYIIGTYGEKDKDVINKNIPTLVIFSLLIIYQFIWSYQNQCNPPHYILISMIIGGGLGALFSYAVDKTGLVQLQYFNGLTNGEVCSRPTKAKYRCSTKPPNM